MIHQRTSCDALKISALVDIFDRTELFETLDNDEVVRLSRLGGRSGFSGDKAILKSTGVARRRMLAKDLRAVDLAEQVCRKIERVTGQSMADFDRILLCHSHVDPNACQQVANELVNRMGFDSARIQAYNHGCAGFLKLLATADELLDQQDEHVCLLSVESPEFWHDASDRLFCGIVSAGATAAVVERRNGLPINDIAVGDVRIPVERRPNPDPLFRKETCDGFDFRGNPIRREVMRMNPEPVFLNGIELMLSNLRDALVSCDYQPGQRVLVAPHQPSAKLLKALLAAARADFPEVQFLNNLQDFGNTISSTVPTCISRLPEIMARQEFLPLKDGDHLILLAAGICMPEISDHMSAGYACLKWNNGALRTAFSERTTSAERNAVTASA